MQVRKLTEAIQ
jgi:hypothetical protein